MAGHLGSERVTIQSLEIVRVDAERGLVLVKGAVPGSKESWVEIRDAVKGVGSEDLPYPAKLLEKAEPAPAEAPAEAQEAQDEGAN